MNLRCIYCQTPFTLGRLEKLAAIQKLQAEGLHHYDAFCPRCRRSNPVSIERLQIFTPGWQEGLRTLEAEAAQIEQPVVAPAPVALTTPEPVTRAPARKHHHKAAKKVSIPAAKKEAPKKAATSSLKGKKPATKPAAKKALPKAKLAAKKAPQKAKPVATSFPKGKKPAVKKPAPKKAASKPKAAAKPKAKPKKK